MSSIEKCDSFSEDSNYKSCFARSVAVNSTFRSSKLPDFKNTPNQEKPSPCDLPEAVIIRKGSRASFDGRRFSMSSFASSRTSMCSSRISDIPVENIANQSKIETLQWQLKETEKSREMYRAVMKQVVTFLEKAHHSLELLGNKINEKRTVPRSRSEHQIAACSSKMDTVRVDSAVTNFEDSYKEMTWTRFKKPELLEEVPPEKLSQEAFRLLRTVQSLLNTREPNLAQLQDEEDDQFLAQLAKEFPSPSTLPEIKPQRNSLIAGPKVMEDVKGPVLNRKLSLQLGDSRRSPFSKQFDPLRNALLDQQDSRRKIDKNSSPPAGSISSVEDESGFSSMNSFQEVGLPLVNSTAIEEVSAKTALLNSMLHNQEEAFYSFGEKNEDKKRLLEEKLWEKPGIEEHRWTTPSKTNQLAKVLWV